MKRFSTNASQIQHIMKRKAFQPHQNKIQPIEFPDALT